MLPSDDGKIELGGRLQVPVSSGEIAFSYHHRTMDLMAGLEALLSMIAIPHIPGIDPMPMIINSTAAENRFGVDAKLDIEIGLWIEAVLVHQDFNMYSLPEYRRFINAGCDYTFGLGNGLNSLAEHLVLETSWDAFGSGERFQFTALSASYPLGMMDTVTGIVYYDWENEGWYRFINWQRTYDNWRVYLIGFWNPEQYQIYRIQSEANSFSGKGVQVMLTFNHYTEYFHLL